MFGVKRENPKSAISTEAQTRDSLAALLHSSGWRVEAEPVIGSVKPDLLTSDESGNTFVIELKQAPRGLHFGSVAQAAAFRDAAALALHRNVQAMLVIVGANAGELDAAGRDYGVIVVGAESSDPDDIAAVVRRLRSAVPDTADSGA